MAGTCSRNIAFDPKPRRDHAGQFPAGGNSLFPLPLMNGAPADFRTLRKASYTARG